MKDKIFEKLKQAYTPLGLGDAILLEHAGALAATGLVTEENADGIVAAQRTFLEQLQRTNDKRVQDAIASSRQKDKEAADKAAADAKAQAAADRAKAIEEARAAERAAALKEYEERIAKEREAQAKEAEERLRKAREEYEAKNRTEIPDWYKAEREAASRAAKEQQDMLAEMRRAHQEQMEAARKEAAERAAEAAKRYEDFAKASKEQQQVIASLKAENDRIKAEQHRKDRMDFIATKAKDMGIPQYRIDEGFAGIGENSTDDEVVAALSTVAKNVRANQLPERGASYALSQGEPSQGEVESLAKLLTKN